MRENWPLGDTIGMKKTCTAIYQTNISRMFIGSILYMKYAWNMHWSAVTTTLWTLHLLAHKFAWARFELWIHSHLTNKQHQVRFCGFKMVVNNKFTFISHSKIAIRINAPDFTCSLHYSMVNVRNVLICWPCLNRARVNTSTHNNPDVQIKIKL